MSDRPTGNGRNGGRVEARYAPYDSATFFSPGFPGMKSTSMEDQVESWPAGDVCDFGCVVTKVQNPETGALLVANGGSGQVAGIAVHDHIVATFGHYMVGSAVSVMTRGRLWCAVDDPAGITEGVPACFNPANGKVSAAGTAIPNAVFRSITHGFYDFLSDTTVNIAEVELHYPMMGPAGP